MGVKEANKDGEICIQVCRGGESIFLLASRAASRDL